MRSIYGKAVLAGLLLFTVARAAPDASPFDAVKDGVWAVYPIGDLTRVIDDPTFTDKQAADQIDLLVRQTVAVDQWTTAGGHAAAMRTTPEHVTVKASEDTQRQIAALLCKLGEQRTIAIKIEYRIVDSPTLRPAFLTPAERNSPGEGFSAPTENFFKIVDENALPPDTKTVLARSEVTGMNAQNETWLDGTGLGLPTIQGLPVVSADRHFTTITIVTAGGDGGRASRATLSLPFGQTAAYPLDEKATRWLLFKPTLMDVTPRVVR